MKTTASIIIFEHFIRETPCPQWCLATKGGFTNHNSHSNRLEKSDQYFNSACFTTELQMYLRQFKFSDTLNIKLKQ